MANEFSYRTSISDIFAGVALLNQAPIVLPPKNEVKPTKQSQQPAASQQPSSVGRRGNQQFNAQKAWQELAAASAEDEAPVVRLGDASIAAPFTAKMSSAVGGEYLVE